MHLYRYEDMDLMTLEDRRYQMHMDQLEKEAKRVQTQKNKKVSAEVFANN